MNFECLLLSAKAGNENAITTILQMYRPLLLKYAIIDGVLDEDLYRQRMRSRAGSTVFYPARDSRTASAFPGAALAYGRTR